MTTTFDPSLEWARARDAASPSLRSEFHLPVGLYFAGHSLGPQPARARAYVLQEMDDWAAHGVEGHFSARNPWVDYHQLVTGPIARLAGALPSEVVVMNTLSVNLHLMLTSFYQPTRERPVLLIERGAFPSDQYAADSQARLRGGTVVETEDPAGYLREHGSTVALALIGTPNYLSGESFDIPALVNAAHAAGARIGLDLAHGMGNLRLSLHDDGPDFAVWCNYKYLNAGPGGLGGAFVHERHHGSDLPRLEGWWGHDRARRFEMARQFVPMRGAEAWQLSNPPILQLAALRASLELFDLAGIEALRVRGDELTRYLEYVLRDRFEVLTPARRGSMLTIRASRELVARLAAQHVVVDFRPPDIVRITPAPLYNTFEDISRLGALFG